MQSVIVFLRRHRKLGLLVGILPVSSICHKCRILLSALARPVNLGCLPVQFSVLQCRRPLVCQHWLELFLNFLDLLIMRALGILKLVLSEQGRRAAAFTTQLLARCWCHVRFAENRAVESALVSNVRTVL